jgi:endoglucanase
MLRPEVMPNGIDYGKNPDLKGLTSLQVLDKLVEQAGKRGIRIILDNHRTTPGGGPEGNGLWYTADYPESRWIDDWKMLAARYKGNPTIVGMDLRNEPHGDACWGCGDPAKDWRLAAEKAGNAILSVNPDLLIIVEGVNNFDGQSTWWGGNLMGAKQYPVQLSIPDRLVYSPHEYPESVSYQSWFGDASFPNNLPGIWDRYWGYLLDDHIAPVMIGEFGTRYETDRDKQWLQKISAYIKQKGVSWTYWSLNPNSGDTGGLLADDWQSVKEEKQKVLAAIQYPFGSFTQPAPGPLPTVSPQTAVSPTTLPKSSVLIPQALNDSGNNRQGAWDAFKDPQSYIQLSLALGEESHKEAVQVNYSITSGGWAGMEQKLNSPQDWSKARGISFSFYGKNTGNRIRFEILDNRASGRLPDHSVGDTPDTAERFEYSFTDNFSGWKDFNLPWSAFQRRTDWQPSSAPNDGLTLKEIWGFNFSPLSGNGEFLVGGVVIK